jgi:hypothetical protein
LLKDIGVSSAGHRLRIRNAIAKLSLQVKSADTTSAALGSATAPTGPDTTSRDTAERRQGRWCYPTW